MAARKKTAKRVSRKRTKRTKQRTDEERRKIAGAWCAGWTGKEVGARFGMAGNYVHQVLRSVRERGLTPILPKGAKIERGHELFGNPATNGHAAEVNGHERRRVPLGERLGFGVPDGLPTLRSGDPEQVEDDVLAKLALENEELRRTNTILRRLAELALPEVERRLAIARADA